MLKNKYQRMSRIDRKKLRKEFFQTDEGKNARVRSIRVLSIAILCILYAAYLVIDTYIHKESAMFYVYAGFTFIAGVIFLIAILRINQKNYNRFALKKGN